MASDKDKCNRIINDDYGRKKYFFDKNIVEARVFYRARIAMLPFTGNYNHDKRFSSSNWLCLCGEKEEESHLTSGSCTFYGDLVKEDVDLCDDNNLVSLFSAILQRREELEAENQELLKKQ